MAFSNLYQNGSLLFPLAIIYFIVAVGYSLWRLSFYNYAIDNLGLSTIEVGRLFAVAAIPGVLAFLIGFISPRVDFFALISVSVMLLGLGMILLGFSNYPVELMFATLAINWGFVWYSPLANNGYIYANSQGRVSISLGHLKSLGPLAAISATTVIFFFGSTFKISMLLAVMGGLVLITGLWAISCFSHLSYGHSHSQLRLRSTLWPFYLLNFLAGSRSAIFKTTVLSQLVFAYELNTQQVSIIIFSSGLANVLSYQLIGKITTLLQPKHVLCGIYLIVAGVFFSFNYAYNLTLFLLLFILDSFLFGCAVITDGYLKQRGEIKFLTGDLALGISAFNLAMVLVAPTVGWIAELYCDSVVLMLGSGVCLTAAIASLCLGKPLVRATQGGIHP